MYDFNYCIWSLTTINRLLDVYCFIVCCLVRVFRSQLRKNLNDLIICWKFNCMMCTRPYFVINFIGHTTEFRVGVLGQYYRSASIQMKFTNSFTMSWAHTMSAIDSNILCYWSYVTPGVRSLYVWKFTYERFGAGEIFANGYIWLKMFWKPSAISRFLNGKPCMKRYMHANQTRERVFL